MRETTRSDAVDRAKEYATPLSDLINPEEVCSTANTWENVPESELEREIYQSVDIILSEANWHDPLKAVLYDRAVSHHLDNMMRVPLDDLSIDRRKAIEKRYWPFDMSRGEIRVVVQEIYPTLRDLPTEDYQAAHGAVTQGLADGMQPNA